jgi:hypothetical protein
MTDHAKGQGPLAGIADGIGRPIDDPALADKANPRWDDPATPQPDAQPLGGPEGPSDVTPPDAFPQQPGDTLRGPVTLDDHGTQEDQAAQLLEDDYGRDNIREGRGGGQPNPALAEGGDNG